MGTLRRKGFLLPSLLCSSRQTPAYRTHDFPLGKHTFMKVAFYQNATGGTSHKQLPPAPPGKASGKCHRLGTSHAPPSPASLSSVLSISAPPSWLPLPAPHRRVFWCCWPGTASPGPLLGQLCSLRERIHLWISALGMWVSSTCVPSWVLSLGPRDTDCYLYLLFLYSLEFFSCLMSQSPITSVPHDS